MKKQLVHESRMMLIKIMSIFLLVSALVSVLYVYVTYNGEKEILLDDCNDNCISFISDSFIYTTYGESDIFSCLDMDSMEYSINSFKNQNNKNINYQAVVFDKSNNMLYGTKNCYTANFS